MATPKPGACQKQSKHDRPIPNIHPKFRWSPLPIWCCTRRQQCAWRVWHVRTGAPIHRGQLVRPRCRSAQRGINAFRDQRHDSARAQDAHGRHGVSAPRPPRKKRSHGTQSAAAWLGPRHAGREAAVGGGSGGTGPAAPSARACGQTARDLECWERLPDGHVQKSFEWLFSRMHHNIDKARLEKSKKAIVESIGANPPGSGGGNAAPAPGENRRLQTATSAVDASESPGGHRDRAARALRASSALGRDPPATRTKWCSPGRLGGRSRRRSWIGATIQTERGPTHVRFTCVQLVHLATRGSLRQHRRTSPTCAASLVRLSCARRCVRYMR